MREIKFRAWNEIDKKMYPVQRLDFQEADVLVYIWGWNRPAAPNVIIMQFTGLHDKNGKEIYEGDCITFYNWKDNDYHIIKWTDLGDEYYNGEGFDMGCGHGLQYNASIVTVIGNIYENPELEKK